MVFAYHVLLKIVYIRNNYECVPMASKERVHICYDARDNKYYAQEGTSWIGIFRSYLARALAIYMDDIPLIVTNSIKDAAADGMNGEACKTAGIVITGKAMLRNDDVKNQTNWCLKTISSDIKWFKLYLQHPRTLHEPDAMAGFSAYHYYSFNQETGSYQPIAPNSNGLARFRFAQETEEIAKELSHYFRGTYARHAGMFPLGAHLKVYLAQAGREQEEYRLLLKQWLERQGVQVMPKEPLPDDFHRQKAVIKQGLNNAHLVVHIIATSYGSKPQGGEKSTEQIQYEIAALQSCNRELKRLVWLPRWHTIADARQKELVRTVTSKPGLLCGATLYTGNYSGMIGTFMHMLRQEILPAHHFSAYLAETGGELEGVRQSIAGKLQEAGIKLFPADRLPKNYAAITNELDYLLSRTDFSIHLLGSIYGAISDQAVVALPELQLRKACEKEQMEHFIWIQHSNQEEERQCRFISEVRRMAAEKPNVHLLQVQLNNLPAELLSSIKKMKRPQVQQTIITSQEPKRRKVFLQFHEYDRAEAMEASAVLQRQRLQIFIADSHMDMQENQRVRNDYLQHAEAVLIVYKSAPVQWLRAVLRDLKRIPAIQRNKSLVYKAILASDDIPGEVMQDLENTEVLYFNQDISFATLRRLWKLVV